jgi:hypothetical protein
MVCQSLKFHLQGQRVKRKLAAQKNATSGEGSIKRPKYLYFDQLLFLLPQFEDRDKNSNLGTERNKEEEEANNLQEEETERLEMFEKGSGTKFATRRHRCRFCDRKKRTIQLQMKTILLIVSAPIFQAV